VRGKIPGYRGEVLRILEKSGIKIGDRISVTENGDKYEGLLIPRSEFGDDRHIVIKLRSGYNIGILVTAHTKIDRVGTGAEPKFKAPLTPNKRTNLPKVSILSTGGTIASRVDYRTGGVRPALSAGDLYSVVPELSNRANIKAEVLFSVFSENITPHHWTCISEYVATHIREGVAGVVVAHGTDTLGYTSAALSFALQNLPVPVVLVGSQRSADRPSSDAATNLIGAVEVAARAPFAEVVVAMHETVSDKSIVLHRGTKVRKCHTSRRDAFKSINSQPIARIDDWKLSMLSENYKPRDMSREMTVRSEFSEDVALLKFYPSIRAEMIEWYVDHGFRGIVLEGTGLGHVSKDCFQAIAKALGRDVIVSMTSQCIWGRVNLNVYDTGRDLLKLGVIPLGDMLPETALVKMMWVLGQTINAELAKKLLTKNVADEISHRTVFYG